MKILEELLSDVPEFLSGQIYRQYCRDLVERYQRSNPNGVSAGREFGIHLERIKRASGTQPMEQVIPTSWGGVDIVSYNHPTVEKFLVVEAGSFLAFEKHDEKIETLIGEEGVGVLVYRPLANEHKEQPSGVRPPLKTEIIKPGWTITLQPGQEHTIVALSNLLVREISKDFKGMDQDLIFIYLPSDE